MGRAALVLPVLLVDGDADATFSYIHDAAFNISAGPACKRGARRSDCSSGLEPAAK